MQGYLRYEAARRRSRNKSPGSTWSSRSEKYRGRRNRMLKNTGAALARRQHLLDAGYIFRHVDANRIMFGCREADAITILEPAQLLQLFDALEIALWKSRKVQQGGAAKHVESQMLEVLGVDGPAAVAHPGNGRAREIQGVAVKIEDGLHNIGVHDVGGLGDRHRQSRYGYLRVFLDGGHRGIDRRGLDQRFVALHVDDDFSVAARQRRLGHPFRAGTMIGAGHDRLTAERLHRVPNPLVIGGHNHARNRGRLPHPLPDSLNHGLARERHQRFARQACRGVARGNHGENHAIDANTAGALLVAPEKPRTLEPGAPEEATLEKAALKKIVATEIAFSGPRAASYTPMALSKRARLQPVECIQQNQHTRYRSSRLRRTTGMHRMAP